MHGVVGILLAGGRGERLGADKAGLPAPGGTFLAAVATTLAEVVDEVLVVGRAGQVLPPLPPLAVPARTVADGLEGRGPLAGVVAGLQAAAAPRAVLVAVDAPRLAPAFLRALLAALDATPDAALALPEAAGTLHPLPAAARVALVRPAAEALLTEGPAGPVRLATRCATVRVPEATLRAVDPDLASLADVDTPTDLATYRALVGTAGPAPSPPSRARDDVSARRPSR